MARKRKKIKLPKIKRVSLFKSDLLDWSNDKLWFFLMTHPAVYRSFARQQKVDLQRSYYTIRYVLKNYDRETLCSDVRAIFKGYKHEVEHDVNWNKKLYRELVVLMNFYLKELKTGEELYSPPANVSNILNDRWLFHSYKFHDLEEEIVTNFKLRYYLHQLYTGAKTIDTDFVDYDHPIQSALELMN